MLAQVQAEHAAIESPDVLLIASVSGHGVPGWNKWFYSSRAVYMAVEPAFLAVLSAGVLQPKMQHAHFKVTPGHCEAEFGAVEHIDWMDKASYGHDTATSLRLAREALMYTTLAGKLTLPEAPALRGELILKMIWRSPFAGEQLYLAPLTLDPTADTDPGSIDAKGQLVDKGPSYRHIRLCADAQDCTVDYAIARDNCKVPQQLLKNDLGAPLRRPANPHRPELLSLILPCALRRRLYVTLHGLPGRQPRGGGTVQERAALPAAVSSRHRRLWLAGGERDDWHQSAQHRPPPPERLLLEVRVLEAGSRAESE